MEPLRRAISAEVHKLVRSRADSGFDPAAPRADAGLFGPNSVAWRVHGDFTTMMVGGISALLLQMPHPGALAGVWDHSDFRKDMAGRLQRTATFIAGTTYGSTAQATALIDRVRHIHDHVSGFLPDGRPYSANDPSLLTWVHVAGAWSFLQAYHRYGAALAGRDQDLYYAQSAVVAHRLGATNVPLSTREVEEYLQAVRPSLAVDGRTRLVADALINQAAPSLRLEPFRKLVMRAGIGLMPPWAKRLHGFRPHSRPATDVAVIAVRKVTSWALARPA